jgi:hypothetical protein
VDEVVISQVYRGKVACGESELWDGVPLTVPPLPPSSKLEEFCKLMDIDYHLDVSISAVFDYKNQTHLIPDSLVTLPDKHFAFCIVSLLLSCPHLLSHLHNMNFSYIIAYMLYL